ncbi:MAG TPA: hypothetical protein VM183_18590 [Burkholderiales bacterium]|nr:hypothetical protein [Burkholderiales bacterium]
MPGKANRMLILEFNELCPRLLARFMDEGRLPNFSRLHRTSHVYTTTTNDEHLEPWVQWVNFHHGIPEAKHRVVDLDEGHKVAEPAFWDVLAQQGKTALVFGSMNTAPAKSELVTLVPDAWSTRVPVPEEFRPFYDFVRAHVLGHTDRSAPKGVLGAFLRFMASHGLSPATVMHLAGQLIHERISRRDVRWRRAAALDYLQWDLFEHLWRSRRPDLAVFFSNSTAFLQHRYWRHMEPQAYRVRPDAEALATYGGAIRYGYEKMDRMVGKALSMADERTAVAFVTAISQQPNLRYEDIGGKFVYRPRDFRQLLDLAGIAQHASVEPVMTHQAWLTCRDEAEAAASATALLGLRMNGEPIMSARQAGDRVFFDCKFISRVPDDCLIEVQGRGEPVPFARYFGAVGEIVNGRHHPDGAFWLRVPGQSEQRLHDGKLPLEEAFQIVLSTAQASGVAGNLIPRPALAPVS